MNELHLFAGSGGGILGGELLGHTCVCAVELDGYCRKVLLQRQRDGVLPRFPIWDDIRTFDGGPWRGRVDIVCGGFPCQDISAAGKGAGITGERSGLWGEMARVIAEVRPRYVFAENSPLLVGRGLGLVLCDLAALGYDARWGIVGAHHAGAPHKRDRIWILGSCGGNDRQGNRKAIGDTHGAGLAEWQSVGGDDGEELPPFERADWWESEPAMGRVAHGVAHRVDRLKAIGNGQVPAVAALAWRLLIQQGTMKD